MTLRDFLSPRQRITGLCLTLLLGFIGSVQAQPASVAGTMPEDYYPTLKTILDVALKQSPTMLSQNIALAQAEAGRYSASSILYPQIGGSASYGITRSQVTDRGVRGPPNDSSGPQYNISINEPLFAWGANKAQSDSGKIYQQIADRQYGDAWRTLASALRAQFLNLVAKKSSLRISRSRLVLTQRDLAAQEQQLREGTISEGEINNPRLSTQEFELSLDRANADYENSKQMFIRLSGFNQLTEEMIPDQVILPPTNADLRNELLVNFRRTGPGATLQGQVYQLSIKRSDLDYKVARTGLLPKFGLGGSYGLGSTTQTAGNTVSQTFTTSYNANVSASWTLFDGFRTRGAKLFSLAAKRSVERQYQTYVDTTVDAAEKLKKSLDLSERAMRLTESRRALAADAVRKVKLDFDEGNSSKYLLDATSSNADSAEYQAVSARIEYLTAWSDYVALVSVDPALAALPSRYLNFDHGK